MKLCGENFLSLFKKILLDKENKKLDEFFFILLIQIQNLVIFNHIFANKNTFSPRTPKLCYYVLVSVIAVKLHGIMSILPQDLLQSNNIIISVQKGSKLSWYITIILCKMHSFGKAWIKNK